MVVAPAGILMPLTALLKQASNFALLLRAGNVTWSLPSVPTTKPTRCEIAWMLASFGHALIAPSLPLSFSRSAAAGVSGAGAVSPR